MEVHHHAHTARKKWTHYFWEFLMLFLAVFCGFLAEYQLEHKIEKDRAKVYAKNLYEELKKDTADINFTILSNDTLAGKLDSYCHFISEKNERNVTNGMLYYYSGFTTYVYNFTSNNTTIEQLKGSGNLRLLGNDFSKKINAYGNQLAQLEREYNLSRTEFEKMEALYFKIFDGIIADRYFLEKTGRKVKRDSVFKMDPPLITDDPKLMKEYSGLLKFESNIYRAQSRRYLVPLKQKALTLLTLLRDKYHIE